MSLLAHNQPTTNIADDVFLKHGLQCAPVHEPCCGIAIKCVDACYVYILLNVSNALVGRGLHPALGLSVAMSHCTRGAGCWLQDPRVQGLVLVDPVDNSSFGPQGVGECGTTEWQAYLQTIGKQYIHRTVNAWGTACAC